MKYQTPLILSIGTLALMALVLQNQPAGSQSNPPPPPHAFGMHYQQVQLTLPAGADEENGGAPGTGSLQLPVLDRTVRISVTFRADNGDVSFGEVAAYYKSSTGECAFQVGSIAQNGGFGFPRFETFDQPGVSVVTGPNGTLGLENFITSPGTLQVAFWY
jgi:hypothetical protein